MEGTPSQVWIGGGYPFPGLDGMGVSPSDVWMGGTPFPGLDWGYPLQMVWVGDTPSQVRTGRHLSRTGWVYPHPDLGRGPLPPRRSGPRVGGTPYHNSLTCSCYAVGGMPLAFTQEDFLVTVSFICATSSKQIILNECVIAGICCSTHLGN